MLRVWVRLQLCCFHRVPILPILEGPLAKGGCVLQNFMGLGFRVGGSLSCLRVYGTSFSEISATDSIILGSTLARLLIKNPNLNSLTNALESCTFALDSHWHEFCTLNPTC